MRIRRELRAHADAGRATDMQSYVKSSMPCLGVRVPVSRQIALEGAGGIGELTTLIGIALRLWDEAEYRDERYAAISLLTARQAHGQLDALEPLRRMIEEGAWWDLVDMAAKPAGAILRAHRTVATPIVHAWANDADLWLRRVAIISQLGAKAETDTDLLAFAVEQNADDPEFFIRKAIGWALRDFARHDPRWVQDFVRSHALSPLSRREALKHIG